MVWTGVSNYGVDAMRACRSKLASRGVPLSSNQIQLSLLYPYALDNGLMDACAEDGVGVLAYSPLALGLLTARARSARAQPARPRRRVDGARLPVGRRANSRCPTSYPTDLAANSPKST